MIDQMGRPGPVALRMPLQAAPIDRTAPANALGTHPGVEADGLFDDILGGIKTVLPLAQAAAPLIAGLV